MKSSNLTNLLGLVILAALAFWFNFGTDESGQTPRDALPSARQNAEYILAVSWQPAFCEQRPNVAECRSQRAGRFDVTNFSLHGLWPQPNGNFYCGVPQDLIDLDKKIRWNDLPKLDLSDEIRAELTEKMPGYRSGLHRHEWVKHGTCMPGYTPEDYFRISLNLLEDLNITNVRKLLADNIGRELNFREIEQVFARSLGPDAAERVVMDCYRDDGRRIIWEFKLKMAGKLDASSELGVVMAAGEKAGRSCPAGEVDRVGLQ